MSNTQSHADLARLFKALSHPHRLAMFVELARCCPPEGTDCSCRDDLCRCVGDLGRDLGVGASTVSHHIKELVAAGLIRCERQGQRVHCAVDPDALRALSLFAADVNPTPIEGSTQ
jgi:DNA-binding transcriptional ArsR family regulator